MGISGLTLRTKLRHRGRRRIRTIPSHEHRCPAACCRRAPAPAMPPPARCRPRPWRAAAVGRRLPLHALRSRGCRRCEDGVEPGRHPVVIAGGGPVGMALALGLANHGMRSVILEADDTVCVGSRAACISRRSLEIIERLGALPAFLAKGLAWTGGRSFYKTDEVFRFEMPHDERQKLPPMINLRAVLHRAVPAGRDRASQRSRTRPDRHPLGHRARRLRAGRRRRRRCRRAMRSAATRCRRNGWSACDGGQSFVRKSLGLTLEGTGLRGPLRDHRHRAAQQAPDRAPRLVRPAVEPGLDRADAPPARRHLAHRLPAARRPEHRGGAAAGRGAASSCSATWRRSAKATCRGRRCGPRSTAPGR